MEEENNILLYNRNEHVYLNKFHFNLIEFQNSPVNSASNFINFINKENKEYFNTLNNNQKKLFVVTYVICNLICEKYYEIKLEINYFKGYVDNKLFTNLNNLIKLFNKNPLCSIVKQLNLLNNSLNSTSVDINILTSTLHNFHTERKIKFLKLYYNNIPFNLFNYYFDNIFNNKNILKEFIEKYNITLNNTNKAETFIVFNNSYTNLLNNTTSKDDINFVNNCTVLLDNIAKANPTTIRIENEEKE